MVFLLTVMPAWSSVFSADLARQILGPEVHQHQVGVGAARHDREPALDERVRQGLGVLHDLPGVDAGNRA